MTDTEKTERAIRERVRAELGSLGDYELLNVTDKEGIEDLVTAILMEHIGAIEAAAIQATMEAVMHKNLPGSCN